MTVMAVTLFCQDAREELNGVISLMGIMPDNVNVEKLPAAIPKLSIYTRINISLDEGPKSTRVSVRAPNGVELGINELDDALVQKAFDDAKAQGNPLAGLIARMDAGNFPAMEGRYLVIVKYGDSELISGSMRIGVG